jgi:hypothetical protein
MKIIVDGSLSANHGVRCRKPGADNKITTEIGVIGDRKEFSDIRLFVGLLLSWNVLQSIEYA